MPADREAVLELWWLLAAEGHRADPRYRMQADAREAVEDVVDGWFSPSTLTSVWVAETDRLVGFVAVRPAELHPLLDRPPTLLLTDAVVDPSARRGGVGRSLVRAVREHALANGFISIEVGTLARDARALAFWRAMGFGDWRVTLESPADRR